MEVTLVHPDNKEQKVVVTHEQQLAAFKARDFVEVVEETDKKKKETK